MDNDDGEDENDDERLQRWTMTRTTMGTMITTRTRATIDDDDDRRYAALQKRTAVAAILDFTDKEWEAVRRLREADGAVVMADGIGDITGASGNGNETTGDTIEEGVV